MIRRLWRWAARLGEAWSREAREVWAFASLIPGTSAFLVASVAYVAAGTPRPENTIKWSIAAVLILGWIVPAFTLRMPRHRSARRLETDRAETRELRDRQGGRLLAWFWLAGLVYRVLPALDPIGAAVTVVVVAGLAYGTGEYRLRAWQTYRLRRAVATAAHAEPEEITVSDAVWDGPYLAEATVTYPGEFAAHRQESRDDLVTAVLWIGLRHALPGTDAGNWARRAANPDTPAELVGRDYAVDFPAGIEAITVRAVPPLPARAEASPPPPQAPGVPVGLASTDTDAASVLAADDQGRDWLCWPGRESHLLIIGATGAGKSVLIRGMVAGAIAANRAPGGVWLADGKGGSDLVGFDGRAGIAQVAVTEPEILALVQELHALAERRFTLARRYERGESSERPDLARIIVVLDELPEIRRIVGDEILIRAARLWRAAGLRMIATTQRGDADTAVPIAYRDQMTDRMALGPLAPLSARMCFETAPDLIPLAVGLAPIPGRGLAHIDGHPARFQTPYLATPRDAAGTPAEHLYPPLLNQPSTPDGEQVGWDNLK